MSKKCINPACNKEISDDSVFCGYCKTKQENNGVGPILKDNGAGSSPIFYADDYEVIRQFDPVITPTKDKVSIENLLATFQEMVKNKNYPFSVECKEQRWRTEDGKGKPRIIIQPIHDAKWQRIIFPISVDQLGNDTTIKLSILRKNEMAEFCYSTYDSLKNSSCTFAASLHTITNISVDYKINWQDQKKYMPIVEQLINYFASKIEEILLKWPADQLEQKNDLGIILKSFISNFLKEHPGYVKYYQEQKEKNIKLDSLNKEEIAKQQPILSHIQNINNEISAQNQKIENINYQVKAASDELASFEGYKIFVVVASILMFFVGISQSPLWLLGPGIYIAYAFIKGAKKGNVTSLRDNDLAFARKVLVKMNTNLNEKQRELESLYRVITGSGDSIKDAIDSSRRNIISAIAGKKNETFQIAEQNECKWREPSFADEELEQLISVVRNLFNQIAIKVTAKKEVKDVKLQNTMGLGGMGFEE